MDDPDTPLSCFFPLRDYSGSDLHPWLLSQSAVALGDKRALLFFFFDPLI